MEKLFFCSTVFLLCLVGGCGQGLGEPKVSDAKELNDLLVREVLDWKDQSRQLDSAYQAASAVLHDIAVAGRYGGASVRQPLRELQNKIIAFAQPCEQQKALIAELDSLSAKLYTGRVKFPDAKKKHEALRAEWREASQKISAAPPDAKTWQTEYEAIFQRANQNAAGNQ